MRRIPVRHHLLRNEVAMNNFLNPVFLATLIGTVASIWAVSSFARAFVQKRTSNKLVSVTTFWLPLYPIHLLGSLDISLVETLGER